MNVDLMMGIIYVNVNHIALILYFSHDVISSTAEVIVHPTHPRGPTCVAEAAFSFPTPGEKDICFQSAYVVTNVLLALFYNIKY